MGFQLIPSSTASGSKSTPNNDPYYSQYYPYYQHPEHQQNNLTHSHHATPPPQPPYVTSSANTLPQLQLCAQYYPPPAIPRPSAFFTQSGPISLPPLNIPSHSARDIDQFPLRRNASQDPSKRHTIHGSDLSLLSKLNVIDALNSPPTSVASAFSSHYNTQQRYVPPPLTVHSSPVIESSRISTPPSHTPTPTTPALIPVKSEQVSVSSSAPSSVPSTSTSSPAANHTPAPTARAQKKYTCHCNRSFTTSGHLARHMRIHTGEKNYECPFEGCSARFSRQDNCMQHYRTHLGGRSRGNPGNNNNNSSGGRGSGSGNRSRKSSNANGGVATGNGNSSTGGSTQGSNGSDSRQSAGGNTTNNNNIPLSSQLSIMTRSTINNDKSRSKRVRTAHHTESNRPSSSSSSSGSNSSTNGDGLNALAAIALRA